MKILLFTMAVLLILFGGGCIVILSPFVATSVDQGGGASVAYSPGVRGLPAFLLALPLLLSGISSIWALLMRSAGVSPGARRILLWIDLAALAAVASAAVSVMFEGNTPERIILGSFTLLMGLKTFGQNRLMKAPA